MKGYQSRSVFVVSFSMLTAFAILAADGIQAQVIYLGPQRNQEVDTDERNRGIDRPERPGRSQRPETPGRQGRPKIVVPDVDGEVGDGDAVERPNIWAFFSPRSTIRGTVERVAGATFSLLGGEVIIDASDARIQYPWWWKYHTDEPGLVDENETPEPPEIISGLKAKVTGEPSEDGTFKAKQVRLYEPVGDGSISGVVQRASAELQVFVVAGQTIHFDDETVFIHRRHKLPNRNQDDVNQDPEVEKPSIDVKQYVTAIVDVETVEQDETSVDASNDTLLKAKFVVVTKRPDIRRLRP